MKKIVILVVLVFLSFAMALAQAQEQQKKSGPSISDWLNGLQKKLEQIVPRKSVPLSAGAAGVRGARESSVVKLYWKGKKDEDAVSEEELMIFKSAIDSAEKGDRSGSIMQIEEFMKQHPDSALIPDAKKALDMMRTEGKEQKK